MSTPLTHPPRSLQKAFDEVKTPKPVFILCAKCNKPTKASIEQMKVLAAKINYCAECIIELFKQREAQKSTLLRGIR